MTHFCKSCNTSFIPSDCLYWNDGAQLCHDECCGDECYPCFYETIMKTHNSFTMDEPITNQSAHCTVCNLSFHEPMPWDHSHDHNTTCTECYLFFLQQAVEFDTDSD